MKKTFCIFGLIKELKLDPETIGKKLIETIFKDYKCEYSKGIITVYF